MVIGGDPETSTKKPSNVALYLLEAKRFSFAIMIHNAFQQKLSQENTLNKRLLIHLPIHFSMVLKRHKFDAWPPQASSFVPISTTIFL